MSAGQRIYRATSYYLPPSQEGNGMTAFLLSQKDAETGSAVLCRRIQALFTSFERKHGLPRGYGMQLQLNGYRK